MQSSKSLHESQKSPLFRRLAQRIRLAHRWTQLKRGATVLLFAFLFWMGSSGLSTPAAHASMTESPSLEKIVDRYVQKHMFDDDTYDPVESLYREAYHDATVGTYPQSLKEISSEALGRGSVVQTTEGEGVGARLSSILLALQKRGLSESAAIAVLAASFMIAGPMAFLFSGMIIGGISKRNMNKLFKERYGDSYTVDATIKTEPDVEAPDDEDDEDDDEGDDDDEDDDDDDE